MQYEQLDLIKKKQIFFFSWFECGTQLKPDYFWEDLKSSHCRMPRCHRNEVIWFPGNWLFFFLCVMDAKLTPVHTGDIGKEESRHMLCSAIHLKWLMFPACSPVSRKESFLFLPHLQNFALFFCSRSIILNSPLSYWGRCKTGHRRKGAA